VWKFTWDNKEDWYSIISANGITRSVSTSASTSKHSFQSPDTTRNCHRHLAKMDEIMIDIDELKAYEAAVLRTQAADPRIAEVSDSSCATSRRYLSDVLTMSN
jgi:hypothetical protein